jgi:hypothetical protein
MRNLKSRNCQIPNADHAELMKLPATAELSFAREMFDYLRCWPTDNQPFSSSRLLKQQQEVLASNSSLPRLQLFGVNLVSIVADCAGFAGSDSL